MKSLRDLQRKADERNKSLDELSDMITEAVREYKRNPSPKQHARIAELVRMRQLKEK